MRSINFLLTYLLTYMPDHVTASSCSMEIWPFEFCEISTFCKVWTYVIAFPEGNSKIALTQAVDQVPYCHHQKSILSSMRKWQRRETYESAIFATSEAPWPWPWPWIRLRSHWCACVVEIYAHTKLERNWKNFLWTEVCTYGRTDTLEFSKSIRTSPGDNLKLLLNWFLASLLLLISVERYFCGKIPFAT